MKLLRLLTLLTTIVFLAAMSTIYAVYIIDVNGHILTFCTASTEKCTFKFFENPINFTLAIYNLTLQHVYGYYTISNAYGFNITDSWFMDKMFLFNGTILFYPKLAEMLGLYTIEMTIVRRQITVSMYVPQSYAEKLQPPLLLVAYEVINNTPIWGQIALIQAQYSGQIQTEIDIPALWYQTYGCMAVYSNKTGILYKWLGVQFLDYVMISLPYSEGGSGSIIVRIPTGQVIKMPRPVINVKITGPVTAFSHISIDSAEGIILVGMILGFVAWGMKRDINIFFAGSVTCFLLGIIALLLKNLLVGGIAIGLGFILLVVRLVMSNLATYGY